MEKILSTPEVTLMAPPFAFGTTEKETRHNWELLARHNFSLKEVLASHPPSPCSFGSEFRGATVLAEIFGNHPKWEKLKTLLMHGADYPMVELDPAVRRRDVEAGIIRGNHPGAKLFQKELEIKFKKEIENGWMLPLPEEAAHLLPFAEYCPTSVVEQMTIDEAGTFIEKRRPIHDQSFVQASSNTSANGRVHKELLDECVYGHMLLRTIHYILLLRQNNPSTKILISKTDLDSAYRRAHTSERASAKSITRFCFQGKWMLLLCLRLTFGGTPGPSLFSIISESLTDLVNAILKCPDWDPEKLSSPLKEFYPPVLTLNENIPFARTKPLSVSIEEKSLAKADVFLDDIVEIGLDTPDMRSRLQGAVALAVDSMSRRVQSSEPLPRTSLINKKKLAAEGRLEETKIVLGWFLDTRRLIISLPTHKFLAWTGQIQTIIKSKKTTARILETVLGRLTNTSSILPMARHFLPRLRYFHSRMVNYKHYTLNKTLLSDLDICLRILEQAHTGVSMNTISFRLPDICYFEDACNHGLGGWNHLGEFYDFSIPSELIGRAHINELEFLACVIHPWMDILNGRIQKGDCILMMGDSTTAMGWLHKSKYREEGETAERHAIRLTIARKLAELVIENHITLYSQWFPGKHNIIADSLSRDLHFSDTDRISLFSSFFIQQDMPRFRRTILPAEILDWTCSVLRTMPKSEQTRPEHTTSGLQIGSSGRNSCSTLELEAIDIWKLFPPLEDRQSWEHSHPSSERHSTREARARQWLQAQSNVPLQMFHRDSGKLDSLIHELT